MRRPLRFRCPILSDNPSGIGKHPNTESHVGPEWLARVSEETNRDVISFLRRRLSNHADADDLSQEVYIRLLRIKEPSEIRNWRAYVLRVAANVAYEWKLLARNQRIHSSDLLETLSVSADTEHEAYIEQQMRTLNQAVESLTPKCRAVLMMHRRDQYTYSEIAAKMGISVSMVKKHLTRGLARCQEAMLDNE